VCDRPLILRPLIPHDWSRPACRLDVLEVGRGMGSTADRTEVHTITSSISVPGRGFVMYRVSGGH
jgi:hypothetical protein